MYKLANLDQVFVANVRAFSCRNVHWKILESAPGFFFTISKSETADGLLLDQRHKRSSRWDKRIFRMVMTTDGRGEVLE
jgi:hypothetical protein